MAKEKKEHRKASTLGASYRAASTGIILASPAIGALSGGARTPEGVLNEYRRDLKGFAAAVVVHAVDNVAGQKLLGHNTALGRGSVTAWVGEAIPTMLGISEGIQRTPAFGTAKYSEAKTGWSQVIPFGLHDSTKLYLGTKYGLGIVRKASNLSLFKAVFQPVKKMLGSAGGAF